MEKLSDDAEKNMREEEELIDLISKLPKAQGWYKDGVASYQGCWCRESNISIFMKFKKHFQAQDGDIVFASIPKSGTTWMKALLFSVLNRNRYTLSNTPLLSSNPHDLIPSFEYTLFSDPPIHNLADIPSPRLFCTHMSYATLPGSVVSKSKIVYICRNPLDIIVSFWHFVRGIPEWCIGPEWTLEDCAEAFCRGESSRGPFWDHVLGFWNASLENPEKVLFLKYEDLLEDTASHVKRVANFLGFPFSEEEERLGVVEQIVELCSLGSLKKLEANKTGKLGISGNARWGCNIYFRKGEVGDWVNHLSPAMVESVKNVIEEKLSGSGLTFKYNL